MVAPKEFNIKIKSIAPENEINDLEGGDLHL
jgi:hypothetical protein